MSSRRRHGLPVLSNRADYPLWEECGCYVDWLDEDETPVLYKACDPQKALYAHLRELIDREANEPSYVIADNRASGGRKVIGSARVIAQLAALDVAESAEDGVN